VAAQPLGRARERAEQLLGPEHAEALDDTLRLDVEPAAARRVNRELMGAGVEVTELRPVERTLEEVFLEMTKNRRGEGDVG
jgi:ABC-2 type transport system ATP-binding protein